MESTFGEDFSGVRLQTGPEAEQSARAMNAAAYTTGENIVLAESKLRTVQAGRLLAHELAHVVQQRRAGSRQGAGVNSPGDQFEKDADQAAQAALQGRPVHIAVGGAPPLVQRKSPDEPKAPSPSELADEELKKSAGSRKLGKEKASGKEKVQAKEGPEKSGGAQRIHITPLQDEQGVKQVNSAEFKREFESPDTRVHDEPGLPKAFASAVQSIDLPHMPTGAGKRIGDNVELATDSAKHAMWVTSVNLDWRLRTAGFLDISAIDDPSMLKKYTQHERGHELIAKRLQEQLAQRLSAELESALPTASDPVFGAGKNWERNAINTIVNRIETIRKRYERLFDQLEEKADKAWNEQEKEALSEIATAKGHQQFTPGESVP
jgi:hypothetical protein